MLLVAYEEERLVPYLLVNIKVQVFWALCAVDSWVLADGHTIAVRIMTQVRVLPSLELHDARHDEQCFCRTILRAVVIVGMRLTSLGRSYLRCRNT